MLWVLEIISNFGDLAYTIVPRGYKITPAEQGGSGLKFGMGLPLAE